MKTLRNILIFIFISAIIIYIGLSLQDNFIFIKAKCLVLYEWLNKQNPMIAGAISLWALGSLSFLAKDVPRKIWRWIIKQTTVTLTINNSDDVYDYFLTWYYDTGRSKKSRTLVAGNHRYGNGISISNGASTNTNNIIMSAGYGVHYFIFGCRIFQFFRTEKEANNTTLTKESITIKTFGRSQTHFHKLIKELTPKKDDTDLTVIYKWDSRDNWWNSYGSQASRKFESVILPNEKRNSIVNHIEIFLKEKKWYIDHGIPYRTGIILHGIPGTGKTSLVQALCAKFKKPLHILSLSCISDDMLEEAFKRIPRNSIVLLEDIDTYSVAEKRTKTKSSGNDLLTILTLSGLLNAIDGVVASEGRILIATTNHLDKIDPALSRKGRFNLTVELSYLTQECFKEFFNKFYPDFELKDNIIFKSDITPAHLQALIMDNRKKPQVVLDEVLIKEDLT
jgi:chaperone BCS1